jgi:hypothetical protein
MPSAKTLWNRYKGLKWYWKVLLGVFFLLAIVGVYVLFRGRGVDDVTNEEVVAHSKAKTDEVVEAFETDERRREKQRQDLKAKRQNIKEKMEKRHEEHEGTINEIERADSAGNLLDLAARLRERNRQRRSD